MDEIWNTAEAKSPPRYGLGLFGKQRSDIPDERLAAALKMTANAAGHPKRNHVNNSHNDLDLAKIKGPNALLPASHFKTAKQNTEKETQLLYGWI